MAAISTWSWLRFGFRFLPYTAPIQKSTICHSNDTHDYVRSDLKLKSKRFQSPLFSLQIMALLFTSLSLMCNRHYHWSSCESRRAPTHKKHINRYCKPHKYAQQLKSHLRHILLWKHLITPMRTIPTRCHALQNQFVSFRSVSRMTSF